MHQFRWGAVVVLGFTAVFSLVNAVEEDVENKTVTEAPIENADAGIHKLALDDLPDVAVDYSDANDTDAENIDEGIDGRGLKVKPVKKPGPKSDPKKGPKVNAGKKTSIGLGGSATQALEKLVFAPYLVTVIWKNQGTRKAVSQIYLKPIKDGMGSHQDNVLDSMEFVDWVTKSNSEMTTVSAMEEGSQQYNNMFGPGKVFNVKSWIENIQSVCPCMGTNMVQLVEKVDQTPKGRLQTIVLAWRSSGIPAITIFRIMYPASGGKPRIGMTQLGFSDDQQSVGIKISVSWVITKGKTQSIQPILRNSPMTFSKTTVDESKFPPWNMPWTQFVLYMDRLKPALSTPIYLTIKGTDPKQHYLFEIKPKFNSKRDLKQAPLEMPDELEYTIDITQPQPASGNRDDKPETEYFITVVYEINVELNVIFVTDVVLMPADVITLGQTSNPKADVHKLIIGAGVKKPYNAVLVERGTSAYSNIFYSISTFRMKAWVESLKAVLEITTGPTWEEVEETVKGKKQLKLTITWNANVKDKTTIIIEASGTLRVVKIIEDKNSKQCAQPEVTVKELKTDRGSGPYASLLAHVPRECAGSQQNEFQPPIFVTIIFESSALVNSRRFVTEIVFSPADKTKAAPFAPLRKYTQILQLHSKAYKKIFLVSEFSVQAWVEISDKLDDGKPVPLVSETIRKETGGRLHTIKIWWEKTHDAKLDSEVLHKPLKSPARLTVIYIWYPDDNSAPQIQILEIDPLNQGQDAPAEIPIKVIQPDLANVAIRMVPKKTGPMEPTFLQMTKALYPTSSKWVITFQKAFEDLEVDYFVTILYDLKYGAPIEYPTRIVLTPKPKDFKPPTGFMSVRLLREGVAPYLKVFGPNAINFGAWKALSQPPLTPAANPKEPYYTERIFEREEGKLQIIRVFWYGTDPTKQMAGSPGYYTVIHIFYPSQSGSMPQVLVTNVDPEEDDYEIDLVILLVILGEHKEKEKSVDATTIVKQIVAREQNLGFKMVATTSIPLHKQTPITYQQAFPNIKLNYIATLLYRVDFLTNQPKLTLVVLMPRHPTVPTGPAVINPHSRIIDEESPTYPKVFPETVNQMSIPDWIAVDPRQPGGKGKPFITEILTMKEYGILQTIKVFWDGKEETLTQLSKKHVSLVHIFYPQDPSASPTISITAIDPDNAINEASTSVIIGSPGPSGPGSLNPNLKPGVIPTKIISTEKPFNVKEIISVSQPINSNMTLTWSEAFVKEKLPNVVTITFEFDPKSKLPKIKEIIITEFPATLINPNKIPRDFLYVRIIHENSPAYKKVFKPEGFDPLAWSNLPKSSPDIPNVREETHFSLTGKLQSIIIKWSMPKHPTEDVSFVDIFFPNNDEVISIKCVRQQPKVRTQLCGGGSCSPQIPVLTCVGQNIWIITINIEIIVTYPIRQILLIITATKPTRDLLIVPWAHIFNSQPEEAPLPKYMTVLYESADNSKTPKNPGKITMVILSTAVLDTSDPTSGFQFSRLILENSGDFDKVFSSGSFSYSAWLAIKRDEKKAPTFPTLKEKIISKKSNTLQVATINWTSNQKTVILVLYPGKDKPPSIKIFDINAPPGRKQGPPITIATILDGTVEKPFMVASTTVGEKPKEETWDPDTIGHMDPTVSKNFGSIVDVIFSRQKPKLLNLVLVVYKMRPDTKNKKYVKEIVIIPTPDNYNPHESSKDAFSRVTDLDGADYHKVFAVKGFSLDAWKKAPTFAPGSPKPGDPVLQEVIVHRPEGTLQTIFVEWTQTHTTTIHIFYPTSGPDENFKMAITDTDSDGDSTNGEVIVKALVPGQTPASTTVVLSILPKRVSVSSQSWEFSIVLSILIELTEDSSLTYEAAFLEKSSPWKSIKYIVTIIYTTGLQFKKGIKDIALYPSPVTEGKTPDKSKIETFVYSRVVGFDSSGYKRVFDLSSDSFILKEWLKLPLGEPNYSSAPDPNYAEEFIVRSTGTLHVIRVFWDGDIDPPSVITTKYKSIVYIFYPADGKEPTAAVFNIDPQGLAPIKPTGTTSSRKPTPPSKKGSKDKNPMPVKSPGKKSITPKTPSTISQYDVTYKTIFPKVLVNNVMITIMSTYLFSQDMTWEYGIIVNMANSTTSTNMTTFECAFAIPPPPSDSEVGPETGGNGDVGWQEEIIQPVRPRPLENKDTNTPKPFWWYLGNSTICGACITGLPTTKIIMKDGKLLGTKLTFAVQTALNVADTSSLVSNVYGLAKDSLLRLLQQTSGARPTCTGGTSILGVCKTKMSIKQLVRIKFTTKITGAKKIVSSSGQVQTIQVDTNPQAKKTGKAAVGDAGQHDELLGSTTEIPSTVNQTNDSVIESSPTAIQKVIHP